MFFSLRLKTPKLLSSVEKKRSTAGRRVMNLPRRRHEPATYLMQKQVSPEGRERRSPANLGEGNDYITTFFRLDPYRRRSANGHSRFSRPWSISTRRRPWKLPRAGWSARSVSGQWCRSCPTISLLSKSPPSTFRQNSPLRRSSCRPVEEPDLQLRSRRTCRKYALVVRVHSWSLWFNGKGTFSGSALKHMQSLV